MVVEDIPPDEIVFEKFVPQVLSLVDALQSGDYKQEHITQQAARVRTALNEAIELANNLPDHDISILQQNEIITELERIKHAKLK